MKFGSAIVLLSVFIASISLPVSANESVWDRETKPYSGNLNAVVYSSPSCSCCEGWSEHLRKHGFSVRNVKTSDLKAIKQKYNLPSELASCHTAIINGYVIEGHVPADDIKRLLENKSDLVGISVPQMPVGTPGMESGDQKEPFTVVSFDKNGKVERFKEYSSY